MFRISGTGCCLVDFIYNGIDFSAGALRPYLSVRPGDGGLEAGKLVFTEDFERFAGRPCLEVLAGITRGLAEPVVNIGGPAVVAMINAAQLLDPGRFALRFVGTLGRDGPGDELVRLLAATPLGSADCLRKSGVTPFTYVLSDPGHDGGSGERTFLNNIGTAWQLVPEDLGADFFEADLVVFGGTALVPPLHDALDVLLARAKSRGAFTVVNTVYDFRSERRDPRGRWPLGAGEHSYRFIDLLVADHEEALRLSGCGTADAALDYFSGRGVGAAVITNGVRDIQVAAAAPGFHPAGRWRRPVSASIVRELAEHPGRRGDTTGCGDNFAGGLVAAIARQLEAGAASVDLAEALAWGAVCGGLACFQVGGVFREEYPGQKRHMVEARLAQDRQDGQDGQS